MKKVFAITFIVVLFFCGLMYATRKTLKESYTASCQVDSINVVQSMFIFEDTTGVWCQNGVMEPLTIHRVGTRAYDATIGDSVYRFNYFDGQWQLKYQDLIVYLKE